MIEFDWDPDKAARNFAKHHVRFEVATRVFLDPGRAERFDGREVHGEDRWVTIGFADTSLLYVVYTVRGDDIFRLISARKANAHERAHYGSVQD